MAKAKAFSDFKVVLREGIPPLELEFIQKLTSGLKFPGGKLRMFDCTKVNDSGNYLEMVVTPPGQSWSMPLRIPHAYVLIIMGDTSAPEFKRIAGFLTDLEEE